MRVTEQLKLKIDADLYAAIKQIADSEDRTVAFVVRRLLREALAQQEQAV